MHALPKANQMSKQQQILQSSDVRVRVLGLSPAETNPWHYHTVVDDIIVCLSGHIAVRLRLTAQSITLSPGQRTTVPAGTIHQVANLDDADSEYLLIQGVGTYDFITVEAD